MTSLGLSLLTAVCSEKPNQIEVSCLSLHEPKCDSPEDQEFCPTPEIIVLTERVLNVDRGIGEQPIDNQDNSQQEEEPTHGNADVEIHGFEVR